MYRLDRYSIAKAILADELRWRYKGIADYTVPLMRGIKALNALAASLIADSNYMERLANAEVEYYLSKDYDSEWREACEYKAHDHNGCPTGTARQKEAYAANVERLFNDEDARARWAYDLVDYDWLRDNIQGCATDVRWVASFLKAHPIEGVMIRGGEYLGLDEVVGFCTCSEPLDETCREVFSHGPDVKPHGFRPGCKECDLDNTDGATCGFGPDALPRTFITCPRCDTTWAIDELEVSTLSQFGRPFKWFPGAPYPPRRTFDLLPADAPPEELETY